MPLWGCKLKGPRQRPLPPLRAAPILKPPALPGDTYWRPFALAGILRRASQMCAIKKLRHVAPLRRMQGIIFRGADKLPEWSAESAHSNPGALSRELNFGRV